MLVFGGIMGSAALAIILVWWCLLTGHQSLFFPILGVLGGCGVALWWVARFVRPRRYR